MIFKLLTILVVATLVHGRSANNNLETLLTEIFGDKPPKGNVDNPNVIDPVVLENVFGGETKSKRDVKDAGNPTSETVEEKCNLPSGGQGVCTKYYLCDSSPDTDNEGLIDIRGVPPPCPSYIDECCDSSNVRSQPAAPRQTAVNNTEQH